MRQVNQPLPLSMVSHQLHVHSTMFLHPDEEDGRQLTFSSGSHRYDVELVRRYTQPTRGLPKDLVAQEVVMYIHKDQFSKIGIATMRFVSLCSVAGFIRGASPIVHGREELHRPVCSSTWEISNMVRFCSSHSRRSLIVRPRTLAHHD